ncbi:MAG: radical SAM protein [Chloroflexi bacterium]|nr:radical SAM protein [Chloroflexota bacterium]
MSSQNIKIIQSTEDITGLLGMVIKYGPKIAQNRVFIKNALAMAEKWLITDNKNKHKSDKTTPPGVIDDGTAMGLAILHSVECALTEHKLSPATFRAASEVLGRDLFIEKKLRNQCSKKFKEQFGFNPPSFLVISPTRACNLHCVGCYADSDTQVQSLDWDLVDKLITDAHDLWGVQFITISGGEPLTYHSRGKTILDLVEKHKDTLFMMYTNGTLITPEVARRIASLGNLVPAVSMEGWRERTDARRGKGVFDKAVAA